MKNRLWDYTNDVHSHTGGIGRILFTFLDKLMVFKVLMALLRTQITSDQLFALDCIILFFKQVNKCPDTEITFLK